MDKKYYKKKKAPSKEYAEEMPVDSAPREVARRSPVDKPVKQGWIEPTVARSHSIPSPEYEPINPGTMGKTIEGTAGVLKSDVQLRAEKEASDSQKVRIIRLDMRALRILLHLPEGAEVQDVLPVGVQDRWSKRGNHIALLIRDPKRFDPIEEGHAVPETDCVFTQHADGRIEFKEYVKPNDYKGEPQSTLRQTHIEGMGTYPSEVSTKTDKGKDKLF